MSGLTGLRLNCCGNGRRSTRIRLFAPQFKFAVLGAAEDRAAMKFHDIGLWVKTDDTGAPFLTFGSGADRADAKGCPLVQARRCLD